MSTKKSADTVSSRVINLDEARAARQESDPVELVLGGQKFNLPPELPFRFAELAGESKLQEALIVLLGEEQADEFFAQQPSTDDLAVFSEAIVKVYGLDTEGNLQGSSK